jgi:PAS domain S-box-containing protein
MIYNNTRILYVEDEKSIIEYIKILFKKNNISNIEYASNGLEALELYKKNSYDLIITDIIMPVMDGFDLIKNIKELNPKQLFMLVTGLENKEDLIRAIKLRISFFVEKPIQPKKFNQVLKEAIAIVNQKKELDFSNILLNQYKQAIDSSTILSKADTKGKITYVNDEFCRLSKYTKEELVGKSHNIVRHPDMPAEIFKDMWETITNKKQWRGIVKNKAKDGSEYIVNALIIPFVDINNEIIEYIGIRHDITQIEQYKELLKEKLDTTEKGLDEKVHLISEYEKAMNESATFSRTDTKGRITFVNDRFCEINGYTKNELLGKPHNIIRHPDMPKEVFNKLWKTIKNKQVWHGILKNKSKSGDATYMDTTIVPILNLNGDITEYMSIRHEVTELINLQQEIEDTQKEVVFTMGSIGETRSKETGNHVKRVAEYSYILAKLVGLSEKDAQLLKLASPMHDIGKVGIPDSILNKPGRHTIEEFEIMKTHSTLGYDMLKGSKREILQTSAIVAYQHHERWDGKGYPQSLKGNNIHIYGRITSICDVFDALGSDRCYKKAWDLDKILDLFKKERGTQFDPNLVDLFFDNLDKFLEIRDMYID